MYCLEFTIKPTAAMTFFLQNIRLMGLKFGQEFGVAAGMTMQVH